MKFPNDSEYSCDTSPSQYSGFITCINENPNKRDIRPDVELTNDTTEDAPCNNILRNGPCNNKNSTELWYRYSLRIRNVSKALHGTIVLCGLLSSNDNADRSYLNDVFILTVEEPTSATLLPTPTPISPNTSPVSPESPIPQSISPTASCTCK